MKVRLAKFLADNGVASRRESERLIESGAVSVNGQVITTPVFFVMGDEDIKVKGKNAKGGSQKAKIYAFNKPINTITSASDPSGRKTIYDILNQSPVPNPQSLKYVGRLDFKTTGLLLLTNSGDLARRLTIPSSNIERVYIATLHPKALKDIKNPNLMRRFLSPTFSDDTVFDILRNGATINGMKYAPMDIEIQSRYPITVKIVLREGKKNEIRVAMDYIGFLVKKLHRISYGPIQLGNLAPGKIRELTDAEINLILSNLPV